MAEAREHLATFVRDRTAELEPWQVAELHLLTQALRQRLAEIGVTVTPDVGAALMATATLLSRSTPEFGGDVRCTLGEIAMMGLALLEEDTPGDLH